MARLRPDRTRHRPDKGYGLVCRQCQGKQGISHRKSETYSTSPQLLRLCVLCLLVFKAGKKGSQQQSISKGVIEQVKVNCGLDRFPAVDWLAILLALLETGMGWTEGISNYAAAIEGEAGSVSIAKRATDRSCAAENGFSSV